MALLTHANLRSAIQTYMENTASDFVADLDNIIQTAEERIQRELDLDFYIQTVTGTLGSSTEILTKPTDLETVRSFYVFTTAGRMVGLQRKHESFCREYWATPTLDAFPRYYADVDEASFLIAPTPDQAYTYNLNYKAQATGIATSTAGTWLSQHAPDVLLFACLAEAARYMKQPPDVIAVWEAKYKEAAAALVKQQLMGGRTDEYRKGDK